ncbi:MAG: hypothetical protein R2844_03865 [Caldilineales bacterium]
MRARRIDNRCAAAPGARAIRSSRFYVALDDDLMMRRFGGEQVAGLMQRMGVDDDMPLEHGMVSKSIERAGPG